MPEITPEIRPLLTVAQVAERLSLAECTVYDLLKRGKLPGLKIGGTWRVNPTSLDGMIEGLETEAAATASPDE